MILGKMSSGRQKKYSTKKKGEYIKKKAPYKAPYKSPYKAVQGVQGFLYKAPYKARRTSESLVRTSVFFNIRYSRYSHAGSAGAAADCLLLVAVDWLLPAAICCCPTLGVPAGLSMLGPNCYEKWCFWRHHAGNPMKNKVF